MRKLAVFAFVLWSLSAIGCSEECETCVGDVGCGAVTDTVAGDTIAGDTVVPKDTGAPPADTLQDIAAQEDASAPEPDVAPDGADVAAIEPLSVVNVIPNEGATEIVVDGNIVVGFSAELAAESVTAESFRVETGGAPVVGQVLADGRTVIFIPALLLPSTEYTVMVSPGIVSAEGAPLEATYSSSFTTGELLSNGDRAPETHEPVFLPQGFHRLTRRAELLVVGDDFAAVDANLAVMDPLLENLRSDRQHDETFARLADEGDNVAWGAGLKKVGVVASLDDDLREDAAIVSAPPAGPGALRVVRISGPRGAPAAVATDIVDLDLSAFAEGGSPADVAASPHEYEIAAGDLNRDGRDEIVVVGRADGAARIWVVETLPPAEEGGEVTFVTLWEAQLNTAGDVHAVAVAIGDLDGDNDRELIVAHQSDPITPPVRIHVRVFGDAVDEFAELTEASFDSPRSFLPALGQHELEVRAGDIDGEFGSELVIAEFAGMWVNNEVSMDAHWGFLALRLGAGGLEELHRTEHTPCDGLVHPYRRKNNDAAWFFELGDFDGDGIREIYLNDWIYDNATGEGLGNCDAGPCLESEGPFAPLHTIPTYYKRDSLAVGDFDGDGADDLAFFGMEEEGYRGHLIPECHAQDPTPTDLSIFSFQERKAFDDAAEELYSVWEWHQLDLDDFGGPTNPLDANTLTLGVDADFDSTVITPTAAPAPGDGESNEPGRKSGHELVGVEQVFHDNLIIAAIAGPPCHEQMGQYLPACSTGLGTQTGATVEAGTSISVTGSAWVGVEAEAQAGVGFGPSATVTAFKARLGLKTYWAASAYSSAAATRSQSITTYAGAGEDLVIFASLPHNRYRYRVVSVDEGEVDPDDAMDRIIAIDVPLGPRILAVSRAYYNRTNGGQADIGSDVLPGDPSDLGTYPSFGATEAVMNAGIPLGLSTPIWVSEGGGYQEIALEFTVSGTVGAALTLGAEVEAENCIAGVCLGATAGLETSAYLQVSMEQGTVVSGAVSALSSDKYAEYLFAFGLYAYLRTGIVSGGSVRHPFVVVGYYVN